MRTHLTLALLALAASLTACSSTPKAMANRLTCTADGQRAIVASMYGPIGVASYIDAADAAAVCKPPKATTPAAQ
jgi:hypothetical protein